MTLLHHAAIVSKLSTDIASKIIIAPKGNYQIPLPDPIEAIKYHMESRGLSRRDLEKYIGSSKSVADILNRKCPLSIDMIRRLNAGLGISADVLIQPYSTVKSAA